MSFFFNKFIYSNKQMKNLPSGDIALLRQENETLKNR